MKEALTVITAMALLIISSAGLGNALALRNTNQNIIALEKRITAIENGTVLAFPNKFSKFPPEPKKPQGYENLYIDPPASAK